MSITEPGLDQAGRLVASGVVRGTAEGQRINEEFSDALLVLQQQNPGVCDILFLQLGALEQVVGLRSSVR